MWMKIRTGRWKDLGKKISSRQWVLKSSSIYELVYFIFLFDLDERKVSFEIVGKLFFKIRWKIMLIGG